MDNWDQIITQNASQQTLEAFLAPLGLGTDRNYSQFLISITRSVSPRRSFCVRLGIR